MLPPNLTIGTDSTDAEANIIFDYERVYCDVYGHLIDVIIFGPYTQNDATFTITEEPRVTAVNIVFENYPFSEIIVYKHCRISNAPLAGAHVRIQGFFVEGNAPQITDRTMVTDAQGRIRFYGLPAGTYTITEIQPPSGFLLDDIIVRSVDVSWGQVEGHATRPAPVVRFYNTPYTFLEVHKIDGITGANLPGTHFRLEDPSTGQVWNAITDANGIAVLGRDSAGNNQLIPGQTYILIETFSPTGFILDQEPRAIVPAAMAQNTPNVYGPIRNYPYTFIHVHKIDGVTGVNLSGAHFRLEDPATGQVWTAVTDANGIAVLGRNGEGNNQLIPGRTYILTETSAPAGFVLNPTPRTVVPAGMPSDSPNLVGPIHNYQNPGLTIIKLDYDTLQPLPYAVFTIVAQGSGRPLPVDFPLVTGSDGRIHIPWTLFEGESERVFIVTEVTPPPGYHLSEPNWQVVTMVAGQDNTVTFRNRRMPDIIIHKFDARTLEDIQGAEFTIERLSEPNRGMLTGNPFRTDENGIIRIQSQHAGQYRIVETRAAQGYWLNPLEQYRSWIINVNPNEDYLLQVPNTLLPTLIIQNGIA